MAGNAPLLEVAGLGVQLKVAQGTLRAVHDVSFTLQRGEALGIVGESGSGKSMTALALMGLLPHNASRRADALRLGSHDLLRMADAQIAQEVSGHRMAMIFQEPMTSLNPVYTIGRQLTETMLLHGTANQAEAVERAVFLLDKVGIPAAASRLGQYPHQLSGGQRQRVMIAMALMNEPELIIADEPTTALDVTIQAQILRLLADLQREFGMAMILITHDLGIVSRTVDKVAVMYAGELVETGTVHEVLENPQHPYTRGLLDCIPGAARDLDHRLGAIPGLVPSMIGETRGCAFANRCTRSDANCRTTAPQLKAAGAAGHDFRCILPANWESRHTDRHTGALRGKAWGIVQDDPAAILSARDVTCTFQVHKSIFSRPRMLQAVDGVSIELARGEILALVGESGCGKSTLAKILLGLQPPTSGTVLLDGKPIADSRLLERTRRIQPVFQDPYSSLNPRRTIGQTIMRPLDIHGIGTSAERQRKVEEIMELVRLPVRLFHSYPNQISGGQRQRVAIARAIITRPAMLICDEPTSALDVSVQSQILNLLLDLRDELGLTYMIITHDLSVVKYMATRVAVMYLGQIVETGTKDDIFHAPRHPYTQALLRSLLTMKPGARVPDPRMGSGFPNPLDMPSGCRFHPRCPDAEARCSSEAPLLGADHVRCLVHGSSSSTLTTSDLPT